MITRKTIAGPSVLAGVLLGAVLMLTLYVYLPVINQWYFSDDFHWLETGRAAVRSPKRILEHRLFNYYRPVVTLSFAAGYALGGLDSRVHHAMNLGIHLGTVLLISLLVRRLGGTFSAALTAAAVYGLSPAGSDAVIWVSGRTDLLAAFFLTAALLTHVCRFRTARVFTVLLSLLAVLAKESAVIIVPAACLLDACRRPRTDTWRAVVRTWPARNLPLLSAGCAALAGHGLLQFVADTPFLASLNQGLSLQQWVLNACAGMAICLVSPAEFLLQWQWPVMAVCPVLAVLCGLACRHRLPLPAAGLGILILAALPAALAPFPFLPDPWLTFRRFFYLPMTGMAIAAAGAFQWVSTARPRLRWIPVILLLAWIVAASVKTDTLVTRWNSVTAARAAAMTEFNAHLMSWTGPVPVPVYALNTDEFHLTMLSLFARRPIQLNPGVTSGMHHPLPALMFSNGNTEIIDR